MFNRIRRNKNGFTLIEIMVVVIVIGALASLALMNYTAVVDRTKIAEAKSILLNGYAGYQRMMFDGETVGGGNPLTWARLGMSDPGAEANRHFDYTFRPNANAPTSIRGTFIKDNSKYVDVSLTTGALTVVNF